MTVSTSAQVGSGRHGRSQNPHVHATRTLTERVVLIRPKDVLTSSTSALQPCIIRIEDVFESPEALYIVLEL